LVLLGLILVELGVVVALGLRLAQPLEQAPPELNWQASARCEIDSVLQPHQVRAVTLDVRAWSETFVAEHGLGPQLAAVLISNQEQALARYHICRGMLQGDPDTQAEARERLATQRKKVLVGAGQLIDWSLAQRYEQELFAAWDQAWMQQLDDHSAGLYAGELSELIPVPSERREGRRDR
jgi:hypothetical protein